jgi:hypothetical protein
MERSRAIGRRDSRRSQRVQKREALQAEMSLRSRSRKPPTTASDCWIPQVQRTKLRVQHVRGTPGEGSSAPREDREMMPLYCTCLADFHGGPHTEDCQVERMVGDEIPDPEVRLEEASI